MVSSINRYISERENTVTRASKRRTNRPERGLPGMKNCPSCAYCKMVAPLPGACVALLIVSVCRPWPVPSPWAAIWMACAGTTVQQKLHLTPRGNVKDIAKYLPENIINRHSSGSKWSIGNTCLNLRLHHEYHHQQERKFKFNNGSVD